MIHKPKHWETRVKKRFLFFPMTIDGTTKWLRWASWGERYVGIVSTPYEDINYWFKEGWLKK